MIHCWSAKISYWCSNVLQLTKEEQLVIQYGIEVTLDGIVKVIVLLLAGYLMGFLIEFMAVLLFFCSLRFWAGGVHCKTSFRCLCAMFLMCLVSVYGAALLQNSAVIIFYISMVIALFLLIFFAPGETVKNPITDEAVRRKKKSGSFFWGILECICICLITDIRWKWILFIAFLIEIISIIPCWESLKKTRRKNYE